MNPKISIACENFTGNIGVQSSFYQKEGDFPGQARDKFGNRIFSRIKCQFKTSGTSGFKFDLYGDYDTTIRLYWFNPKELYVYKDKDNTPLTLTLGYQQKPMGYMEADHPNGLFNPVSWLNGLFNSESIGRLSAGVRYQASSWQLYFDIMPLRQFDIWAKEKRRFRRGGFVIREREFAPGTQISEQLRLDYFGGDLELSAMYWHGLSPQSRVISSTVNPLQLVDYYDRINQFGLSIIYLVGDLSFKGDYYFRETTTANIVNVSSGIEWLQYEIFDSRVDLALFLEGYYLKKVGAGQMFSPNSFDHDLFLGARFAANDTNSSKIELGIIYDWKTISHSFYARFSQNILDQWQYKIGVEWYNPTQQDMLLSGFVNDSRATFELSRFF